MNARGWRKILPAKVRNRKLIEEAHLSILGRKPSASNRNAIRFYRMKPGDELLAVRAAKTRGRKRLEQKLVIYRREPGSDNFRHLGSFGLVMRENDVYMGGIKRSPMPELGEWGEGKAVRNPGDTPRTGLFRVMMREALEVANSAGIKRLIIKTKDEKLRDYWRENFGFEFTSDGKVHTGTFEF